MSEIKDGHGTLNWIVTWQSTHGGICIEYETNELNAAKRSEYLEKLGCIPQVATMVIKEPPR